MSGCFVVLYAQAKRAPPSGNIGFSCLGLVKTKPVPRIFTRVAVAVRFVPFKAKPLDYPPGTADLPFMHYTGISTAKKPLVQTCIPWRVPVERPTVGNTNTARLWFYFKHVLVCPFKACFFCRKYETHMWQTKKAERRIDTLHEHLRHSDNFKKYRKHKRKYESLYSEYEAAKNPQTSVQNARRTRHSPPLMSITKFTAPSLPNSPMPRNVCAMSCKTVSTRKSYRRLQNGKMSFPIKPPRKIRFIGNITISYLLSFPVYRLFFCPANWEGGHQS